MSEMKCSLHLVDKTLTYAFDLAEIVVLHFLDAFLQLNLPLIDILKVVLDKLEAPDHLLINIR